MRVRIAAVQFVIAHLDREKNFIRMEKFVCEAKARGANVIVFPEDCVTSSIFGDLSQLDTTKWAMRRFQAVASTHGIDIVTGSVMEGIPEGNFNTSYYIDARGEVRGMYRKNHLYPSEYRFLQPGTEVPVFETAYGRVGMVICWDMLFPEIFMRMKAQGVQIVYCPSYWYREIAEAMAVHNPSSEEQQMDAMCITRALETNAVMVYCNAAGVATFPNGSCDTLIGHSQIVMPVLGTLQKADHHNEVMLIQDVDLSLLEKTAHIYRER